MNTGKNADALDRTWISGACFGPPAREREREIAR